MIHASLGLFCGPLLNVISPDDLVLSDLDPTSSLLERESSFTTGGCRGENQLLSFLRWRKVKRRDIWEDERVDLRYRRSGRSGVCTSVVRTALPVLASRRCLIPGIPTGTTYLTLSVSRIPILLTNGGVRVFTTL